MGAQIRKLLLEGVELQNAGRLGEAAARYRAVLAQDRRQSDALNLLGLISLLQGDHKAAAELIGKAVAVNPRVASYHNNLGEALRALGRMGEAEQSYRRAIAAQRDYAPAHLNLGTVLSARGRYPEAEAACRAALALTGPNPAALTNLGNILAHGGKLAEAEECHRHAAAMAPGDAEIAMNHGNALRALGRHDEARERYARALALQPDYVAAHYNLGWVHQIQGRLEEAIACYERALALDPQLAEAHNARGGIAAGQGRLDDAVAAYRRAIELKPDNAEALTNLGVALKQQGKLDEALAACARAVELKPEDATAQINLGTVLQAQGRLDEAEAAYAKAVALDGGSRTARENLSNAVACQGRMAEAEALQRTVLAASPDAVLAHSNLLFCLNYRADVSPDYVFERHREWGMRHAEGLARRDHANDRTPEAGQPGHRRLRVGYVSPDFKNHSVARFFLPLLTRHDRAAIEVTCYAELKRPDAVSERIRVEADRWCPTVGLSNDELAACIRADAIDILVDLAGHTSDNRLLTFARTPAPVQVSWLGYANSTGVAAIDYRFSDAECEPPGDYDRRSCERIWRLPRGFHCFGAPEDVPAVAPPPSAARGAVTFGSFNNFLKLAPETIALWGRVLAAVPGSRLMLKSNFVFDAAAHRRHLERFVAAGIDADRITILPYMADDRAHLAAYAKIDVALDPFPYNGTTTTCEALWMGVPVVALRGDRHAARVGVSLLTRVGLPELIADDTDAYVATATALAGAPERLTALRAGLRAQVAASPLCDAAGFARDIEAAYRAMWRTWCAGAAGRADFAGNAAGLAGHDRS
jgi:predicted O-linked N-acetylglucosamine transferase (SPINDLY family)